MRDITGHPVNALVWDQFEKQKSRGVDGFGVFNGEFIYKTPKLKKMRQWLRKERNQTDFLMFHHRYPTSTINVSRGAHPFTTGDFFVVNAKRKKDRKNVRYILEHNGVISNAKALKAEHEKLGIVYQSILEDGTFNDSEALLWDFALTMEGKQQEMKAYGGIAFVVAKLVDNELSHLMFGKNFGRPLKLYKGKEGIIVSSEGPGEDIKEHQLYTYNWKLNRVTNKYFRVPSWDPESYSQTWNSYQSSKQNTPGRLPSGGETYHVPSQPSTHYPLRDIVNNRKLELEQKRIIDLEEDVSLYIPKAGVDFYYNEDGEAIYFDDEQREQEIISDGKTVNDLRMEQYDQEWWLNEFAGSDKRAKELPVWAVYSTYMKNANGLYEKAFNAMDEELSYYVSQRRSRIRDLIVATIEECMEMIVNSGDYIDSSSADDFFVNWAEYRERARAEDKENDDSKLVQTLIGAGQEG